MFNDHTFVICAYKKSEYLEECIKSIMEQSIKSNVIICTATPNEYIKELANKYHIPLYINANNPSISGDWNFGIKNVKTRYFTIAHQDDIYKKQYVEFMKQSFESVKNPLIFFTDYAEIRNGIEVSDSKILKVKRIMLLPLRVSKKSKWIRRRVLSLGNPICCPSVSFCKENLPKEIFKDTFQCDLDWDCWERLSKFKGAFCYSNKVLMCHRIHEESTTTELIENNTRLREDYEMYLRFWPKFIANILLSQYKKSMNSNDI